LSQGLFRGYFAAREREHGVRETTGGMPMTTLGVVAATD